MPWSHPDVSAEDFIRMIQAFVDMLILSSGYQSSGSTASWDSGNITKVVQWGVFLQQIFRRIRESDDDDDHGKQLDAVLSQITSHCNFPQGLKKNLSSTTMSQASELVLGHLFQTIPLRDAHLSALLTAVIDMDIVEKDGNTDLYIENLTLLTQSLDLVPVRRMFMNERIATTTRHQNPHGIGCPSNSNMVIDKNTQVDVCNSGFMVRQILKRQAAASYLSAVERENDNLLKIVRRHNLQLQCYTNSCLDLIVRDLLLVFEHNKYKKKLSHREIISLIPWQNSLKDDQSGMLVIWNRWRTNGLSYLLDKRTARLHSGANLIFSAPKDQWVRVFENLKVSNENLLEITELVLLGLISGTWNHLIEHLMSVSCICPTFPQKHYHVQKKFHIHQLQQPKIQPENSKEKHLLEYLAVSLASQSHIFWKLPPILVAAAIPSCSVLSRLYMNAIEKQLNGQYTSIKFCTCIQDGKDHRSCEVAERFWCLNMFQAKGPQLACNYISDHA